MIHPTNIILHTYGTDTVIHGHAKMHLHASATYSAHSFSRQYEYIRYSHSYLPYEDKPTYITLRYILYQGIHAWIILTESKRIYYSVGERNGRWKQLLVW